MKLSLLDAICSSCVEDYEVVAACLECGVVLLCGGDNVLEASVFVPVLADVQHQMHW